MTTNKALRSGMCIQLERNYVLHKKMKEGGGKQVFTAYYEEHNEDKENGRVFTKVIMKFTRCIKATDKDKAIAEAYVLGMVRHPAIPRVIETGEYGEYQVLVLEYVDGISIGTYFKQQSEAKKELSYRLMYDAAEIFRYLHSFQPKVIYRDLKPEHLLVDKKGQLHLIDFDGVLLKRGDETEEEKGELAGNCKYSAPEQFSFSGGIYLTDERSDIYSLGAVFQSVMEEIPYHVGKSKGEKEWNKICRKCMEREPAKRYQSMEELEQVLWRVQKPKRAVRKRLRGVLFGILLMAVLLGGSKRPIEAGAKETMLPVVFYNQEGQKILIRHDAVYHPENSLKMELPEEFFEGGQTWKMSLSMENTDTGERFLRTLTLK